MTADPMYYPEGPAVDRVEISSGRQDGPAKLTGQFGTRLDYSNAGGMIFHVEAVGVDGSRLTLYCDASYEAAIVDAEEAAKDWAVAVHDVVTPI